MRILYNARSGKPEMEAAPINAIRRDLDDGLAEADVVTLNCPLTDETHHLMDARRIGLMKPSAILVNTARGPVIDEEALVDALESGKIHAAGLDVYEHEPKIHPRLLELENAILLPHIGSSGEFARERMTQMVVENLLAALSNEEAPNRVRD
jgi:glyoxylate reductase